MAPWTIKETCGRIIELLKKNQFEEAVYAGKPELP
jgi:hypothetical protein